MANNISYIHVLALLTLTDYTDTTVFLCSSLEFEPDGYTDLEIYHMPPGVNDLLRKTVLIVVTQIDHFYSNHLDASKPGTCK